MAKLEFSISDVGPQKDIKLVSLAGHLDSNTVPQLESALEELVENENNKIIIDCERLEFISSSGLGLLMVILDETQESEGDLKLIKMLPEIKQVFQLLGFADEFDILASVDEAIERF